MYPPRYLHVFLPCEFETIPVYSIITTASFLVYFLCSCFLCSFLNNLSITQISFCHLFSQSIPIHSEKYLLTARVNYNPQSDAPWTPHNFIDHRCLYPFSVYHGTTSSIFTFLLQSFQNLFPFFLPTLLGILMSPKSKSLT